MTPSDYVGIPVPPALPVPLNPPCLVWRWQLRGGGYGVLQGKGDHVIAFEQTRRRAVREERQVNHLCNQPFCIQPAHLYEGTAKQNSEDLQAEMAGNHYQEWRAMTHRFDRALTRHHWRAPALEAVSRSWEKPIECPHEEMPEMFARTGKEKKEMCVNCGAERFTLEGRTLVIRPACLTEQPCRCTGMGEDSRPGVQAREIKMNY